MWQGWHQSAVKSRSIGLPLDAARRRPSAGGSHCTSTGGLRCVRSARGTTRGAATRAATSTSATAMSATGTHADSVRAIRHLPAPEREARKYERDGGVRRTIRIHCPSRRGGSIGKEILVDRRFRPRSIAGFSLRKRPMAFLDCRDHPERHTEHREAGQARAVDRDVEVCTGETAEECQQRDSEDRVGHDVQQGAAESLAAGPLRAQIARPAASQQRGHDRGGSTRRARRRPRARGGRPPGSRA